MDGKHPNRKKDKLNPYTLSIKDNNYYIEFIDGQGCFHKQEISMDLYATFSSFELDDVSQMNAISRHLEQSELTEETISQRVANPPELVEDQVYRKRDSGMAWSQYHRHYRKHLHASGRKV